MGRWKLQQRAWWEGKDPTNSPGSDWEGSVLDKGLHDPGGLLMWSCLEWSQHLCASAMAMTPVELKTLFLFPTEICS